MISAQVAKDVITRDCLRGSMERESEGARSASPLSSWRLLGGYKGEWTGEMNAMQKKISVLCAELDKAKEDVLDAKQTIEDTKAAAAASLNRRDMVIEDLQARLSSEGKSKRGCHATLNSIHINGVPGLSLS